MSDEELKKIQIELEAELEKSGCTLTEEETKILNEVLNRQGGNYLGVGVHKVKIMSAELTKSNQKGTLGIKFKVENEDGEATTNVLWLSQKALPYTIDRIAKIFIHNKTSQKDKDKRRQFFGELTNPFQLWKIVKSKSSGLECWIKIVETDETFTNANGELKHRMSRDIYGFEPKLTQSEQAKQVVNSSEPVDDIDLSEIPF